MKPTLIFNIQLVLGYVAWLLCFGAYVWPKLRSMHAAEANRAIATLHSFRFFGLIFIFPGLIGAAVPSSFAIPAAWGDLATSLLAMGALIAFRIRPLFWTFVVAFNAAGTADLVLNYYHAVHVGLPEVSAQLGSAYLIPILYVPLLMITHGAAFLLMARPGPKSSASGASDQSV
ncbi:MAG: hypothetical protein ACJ8EP_06570, partial [Sphingomicrobium sp.]